MIFSPMAAWLFFGRFLAGFSAGATFTLIPMYIAEISQDEIRGSLGSFFILSTNFGMLLIYIAGNIFDYFTAPKVMLLLPILFLALFSIFPDTPIYLLRNHKLKEAERSLRFLRGVKQNDAADDVKFELQKMIRKVDADATNKRGSTLDELSKRNENVFANNLEI